MPKTIRELADELKVSKQTIQYHYQRLPAKNRQKDSRGVNQILPTAERIIRNKVAKKQQIASKETNELVATLRREVEDLKCQRDKQLAIKEQQIDGLIKLLDQSQKLQLMAENKTEEFKRIISNQKKNNNTDSKNDYDLKQRKSAWWHFW